MKEKSLSKNIVLNSIKTLCTLLFPLITFPYISRTLQVDNLGKVNFATSIVSYFVLISELGINAYAIREGAIVRDDVKRRNKFVSEIFSINIISTLCSYLLLIIVLVCVPRIWEYRYLIIINSTTIIFTTLGINWLYSIYEDYTYITVRSIVFQIVALVLMFVFVRDINDYYLYMWILVIQSVGANIMNFLHSKKFCTLKLTLQMNWKIHLKPIMILFATNVATTIYVSSDMTILGFMSGEYHTGLYTVSSKIYRVVKLMLAAVLQVSIPRLSNYYNTGNKSGFHSVLMEIGKMLTLLLVPIVVGMYFLSDKIIIMISGIEYQEATTSLRVLCISLLFAIIAWYLSQCVLIPLKLESIMLKTTIVSALLNLILNIILIPIGQQDAAAFTTLIAEGYNAIIYIIYARRYLKWTEFFKNLRQVLLGCCWVLLVVKIAPMLSLTNNACVIISIIGSVLGYGLILILLKNEIVLKYIHKR